jgi:hypothetical protein
VIERRREQQFKKSNTMPSVYAARHPEERSAEGPLCAEGNINTHLVRSGAFT